MRRFESESGGILDFIGLPPATVTSDGSRITTTTYGFRLTYLLFEVSWVVESDALSIHEAQVIHLPLIHNRLRDRFESLPRHAPWIARAVWRRFVSGNHSSRHHS